MRLKIRLVLAAASMAVAPLLSAESCEDWTLLAPAALPVPDFADWTTSVAGFNPADGLTHILIAEEGQLGPSRWFTWNGAALQERIPANEQLPFPGMHMGPSYSMCYDEANERMLCLSGNVVYELHGDRWEILPLLIPVQGARAVYDSARGHVFISKGGVSYILDGLTVIPVTADGAPPAREYGGLVYDALRHVTVLHGGRIGSTALSDTWEWNGVSWSQRMDVLAPTPAFSFAMAWDPARQRIVRQGGRSTPINPGAGINETWIYPGGEAWSLAPSTGVGPKHRHAMAAHDTTGRLLIVGGEATEGGGELWISDSPLSIPFVSESITARTGEPAALWVHAIGENLTYEWRRDDVAIPGASSPVLFIEAVTEEDEGSYECLVSTPCESQLSFPIDLTTLPAALPGDVDGDGDVDFADLNLLLSNYNTN